MIGGLSDDDLAKLMAGLNAVAVETRERALPIVELRLTDGGKPETTVYAVVAVDPVSVALLVRAAEILRRSLGLRLSKLASHRWPEEGGR